MDPSIRDHKLRKLQRVEVKKWAKLTERIENLRTQLSFPQENREEDKEEEKCEELRQEIFNNEELYIDLQRNWTESGGRHNVKTVKTSSPLKQEAAVMTHQQSPGSLGHENDSTSK